MSNGLQNNKHIVLYLTSNINQKQTTLWKDNKTIVKLLNYLTFFRAREFQFSATFDSNFSNQTFRITFYFILDFLPRSCSKNNSNFVFHLVRFNVIILKCVQLVGDECGFVSEQLDLLLVRFEDIKGRFNLLQFVIHFALGVVDHAT